MRPLFLAAMLGIALVAPVATALDVPSCPADPRACGLAYASVTVDVGPVHVVATLRINGSAADAEASAQAQAGDDGTIAFKVVSASANATGNESVNVSILVQSAGLPFTWPSGNATTIAWSPDAAIAQASLPFHVDANATPASLGVPFTATVGNETKSATLGVTIIAPGSSKPAPGPALGLAVAAVVVGAVLRRRNAR